MRFAAMLFLVALLPSPLKAEFSVKVVEKAKTGTVFLVAMKEGKPFASGSGFVVSKQGHIATNFHVVDGSDGMLALFLVGNKGYCRQTTDCIVDPAHDLAIIMTDPVPGVELFPLAVDDPSNGQSVMAIGFPGVLNDISNDDVDWERIVGAKNGIEVRPEGKKFLTPVTFSGEIGKLMTASPGSNVTFDAILHDAKISWGNSGGPLIDAEGRVIGVNQGGQPATVKDSSGNVVAMGEIYTYAIQSSHLAALARANNIPVIIDHGAPTAPGSFCGINLFLILAVAGLSIVTFLLVLRKPRAVIVGSVSRLVGTKASRRPSRPAPSRSSGQSAGSPRIRLRGRAPGGQSFDFGFDAEQMKASGGRLIVGRNPDLCQLHLPHDSVSRQHATLILNDGKLYLEDRSSGNGTFVNGNEIPVGGAPAPLHPNDRLTLGEVDLMVDVRN
jgi:hypothetical protein